MFILKSRIVLFLTFLILVGITACQQNQRLPKPVEANYDPVTQFSLPEGAKARLGKGTIQGIEYSADGSRLAVFCSIGVWLYDAVTLQELSLLTENSDYVYSGSISQDGTRAATGFHNGSVHLWDVNTRKLLRTLKGHDNKVLSVRLSPDGQTIASANKDRTVTVWNVSGWDPLVSFSGHGSIVNEVSFSPDGRTIASASRDGTVLLWDVPQR